MAGALILVFGRRCEEVWVVVFPFQSIETMGGEWVWELNWSRELWEEVLHVGRWR